jgi:putative SOS response-associated peptidase YedK
MPVILNPGDYELWLDPEVQEPDLLQPLLHPYPAQEMDAYPVSRFVNRPGNDSPQCVEPLAVAEDQRLPGF